MCPVGRVLFCRLTRAQLRLQAFFPRSFFAGALVDSEPADFESPDEDDFVSPAVPEGETEAGELDEAPSVFEEPFAFDEPSAFEDSSDCEELSVFGEPSLFLLP